MATSTALSTALTALAEQVAPGLDSKPIPTPAHLYAALIRARDEATCLEARASARDASVHRLIAQVTTICDEMAGHAARIAGSSPLPHGEGLGVGSSEFAILAFDSEATPYRTDVTGEWML